MMMREYVTTPGPEIEEKFNFFYQPYSYAAQAHKSMRFEELGEGNNIVVHDQTLAEADESYFQNVKPIDPWMLSRKDSKDKASKIVESWLKNKEGCVTWKPVHDFIFEADEDTFQFVIRQLSRALGNEKFH
jgi:hypothetical protein